MTDRLSFCAPPSPEARRPSWSRQARVKEPPIPEPERIPARREPIDWFSNPVRVSTAKAWGDGSYEWAP